MTAAEIKVLLDAKPFVPLIITARRTGSYSLDERIHAMLSRDALYLAEKVAGDGIAEHVRQIPLSQIVSVETAA